MFRDIYLNNIPQGLPSTVQELTFAALDALPNAGDADQDSVYRGFAVNNDISADAANCSAVNGTIQRLWKSASKYVVEVCVLPVAPSTTSPPSPPPRPTPSSKTEPMQHHFLTLSVDMGLIIGVVVGGLVVLGAIAAFVILKRRTVKPPPTPVYYPYEGGDNFDTVNDGRTFGSNGTKIVDTNGTWGATSGYRN
ncbi:hypothetical protein SPRG_15541 [Saprolegnia parasitica CBS 223.65]|uniref:Uncharacterized protein n=1 Tax=Saprolegnia parasitica (strain CBS 223.65) TaxID=695850 RepID=A0A067BXI8_SAPPC|nr:hypothetical protein SPRG_15541 [Saprolegnia parasitica CBS 223.65]KDO19272.1 hypothetical protein SPRG_15541 [Saprolegnia parasitica CBS 223.65]|eukprot:XP_012210015.1 hypothetical protein SPRG_15541 [Saprolegnia parasitica CBS 223.65]